MCFAADNVLFQFCYLLGFTLKSVKENIINLSFLNVEMTLQNCGN